MDGQATVRQGGETGFAQAPKGTVHVNDREAGDIGKIGLRQWKVETVLAAMPGAAHSGVEFAQEMRHSGKGTEGSEAPGPLAVDGSIDHRQAPEPFPEIRIPPHQAPQGLVGKDCKTGIGEGMDVVVEMTERQGVKIHEVKGHLKGHHLPIFRGADVAHRKPVEEEKARVQPFPGVGHGMACAHNPHMAAFGAQELPLSRCEVFHHPAAGMPGQDFVDHHGPQFASGGIEAARRGAYKC